MSANDKVKKWKIWGTDYQTRKKLPVLSIEAENFDKAIAEARKINGCYCAGQPTE